MYIDFRILRHIEVVNVCDAGNIKASGSDVSSNEDINGAFLELAYDGVSLLLGQVTVKTFGHVASLLQSFGDFIAAALGAYEYDSQFGILHIEQTAECVKFLTVRQFDVFLFDQVDGYGSSLDLDDFRVLQECFSEFTDRSRHGSGEEHGLSFFRNSSKDRADVVDESHIDHFIAFIKDENLYIGEVDRAALHMVHQTARGSYDDVWFLAECLELAFNILTAVDRQCVDRQVLCKMVDFFSGLDSQFSGWRKDDRLRTWLCCVNAFQYRDTECCGFACACLCLTNQILSGKCYWNGDLLDRGRFLEPHILYGLQNFRLDS